MKKFAFFGFDDDPTVLADLGEAVDRVKSSLSESGEDLVLKTARTVAAANDEINRFRRSTRIPIFILDIRIDTPESGKDLLVRIRETEKVKHAPVVMVSGYPEEVNDCIEMGANAFHRKIKVTKREPNSRVELFEQIIAYWIKSVSHTASTLGVD